ncbi:unnamed protein product, partial [Arctogadus glacialis]
MITVFAFSLSPIVLDMVNKIWQTFSPFRGTGWQHAEYQVGGECCPTCPPGMYVSRHCTEYRSTSCASCTEGTFQDGNNGREQCFSCKHCDAGLGLKVKKLCSSTSDAVCEPLDEFFCSDSNRGGCRAAQRHTVCSPGQYIGQRGTADEDTECLHCTDGTFLNGTSSCQPHTTCDSGVQVQPGTDSTDSTCITYVAIAFIIIGCICFIISLVLGALFYRWLKMERELTELDKLIPKMETQEQRSECYALRRRLKEKKKTPKQKRKFDELADRYNK